MRGAPALHGRRVAPRACQPMACATPTNWRHACGPARTPRSRPRVVDAVVVNETLFFRDRAPFDSLRTSILPAWSRRGATASGCGCGARPVRRAGTLFAGDAPRRTGARPRGLDARLVATDISRTALADGASRRLFAFRSAAGPVDALICCAISGGSATGWEISEALRAAVAFSERNLLADFRSARNVRHRLLPQRPDVYGRRRGAPIFWSGSPTDARAGRLSRARCRRDDRRV